MAFQVGELFAKIGLDAKAFDAGLGESERKFEGLRSSLEGKAEKMKSLGKTMSVALTAPIVAGGGLMLKGAMDAQAAQGKLQAALGLTKQEAEALGGVAKDVWASGFGESIDEVTQAVTDVRLTMGELAGNELKAVTEGAMTIAKVFDQDVNEVSRTAGVMMKNFGIEGTEAMDLITTGFQQGGDYSGELLDTLREYSPQFQSLGLSADQALAMLIKGAEAGAWNLDKVGDSLKEFNIRAQDGSKTTAEGFAAIGLDAQKMGADIAKGGDSAKNAFMMTVTALSQMKDPMEQNIAGVALFGTQWEDVRSQVITAMADGVEGIKGFEGATAEATAALQESNPGLAMTQAMREIQNAVGPALLPVADVLSNTVAPAIKGVVDAFVGLGPVGQKVVLGALAIVAAIGPVTLALGTILPVLTPIIGAVGILLGGGGVAGLIAAFPVLGTVIGGVGTAFTVLLGPVGLIIAGIAAVIAIGVALYKNWDEIAAFAGEMWNNLKAGWAEGTASLKVAWADLGKQVSDTWNGLWAGVRTQYDQTKAWLLQTTSAIISGAMDGFNSFKAGMASTWDAISSGIRGHVNKIIGYVNKVIGALNGISVDVPDWVPIYGGSSFGIDIPKVSYLARGGIVDQPTLAMLGEGGKREAVVPLENTGFVNAIASAVGTAVLQAMQFSAGPQNTGPQEVEISLDGVKLGRAVLPRINSELERMGIPGILRTV